MALSTVLVGPQCGLFITKVTKLSVVHLATFKWCCSIHCEISHSLPHGVGVPRASLLVPGYCYLRQGASGTRVIVLAAGCNLTSLLGEAEGSSFQLAIVESALSTDFRGQSRVKTLGTRVCEICWFVLPVSESHCRMSSYPGKASLVRHL